MPESICQMKLESVFVCPDWPNVLLAFSLPFSNATVEQIFLSLKYLKDDRQNSLTLCYRKTTLVAFNTCPLKFIHNSFNPGATELKLPSFYSGCPDVSKCEAKISSQENQHHLEYTKEV